MVHELIVPFTLAGLQVDGDERLGEEVVAGPVTRTDKCTAKCDW
jgi:hypothetical protein